MIGRRRNKALPAEYEEVATAAAPVADDTTSRLAQLPQPVPVQRAAPIPPLSSAGGTSALDAAARHADGSSELAADQLLIDAVGAGDGTQARPGWYPDPAAEADHRWWDGTKWTEHLS